MAVVWVFPGQGAQRKGRGVDLLPAFPDLVAQAEDVLGHELRDILVAEETSPLRRVPYLQPAVFAVSVMSYLDRVGREPPPDYLAGHSLGEYAALFAAGCIDFPTCLRLVRRRAELMQRPTGGAMMAVVGLPADELLAAMAAAGATGVDIANVNSPHQCVLAGPADTVRQLGSALRAAGAAKCVILAAEGAGHSRYLEPVVPLFAEELARVTFRTPRTPVVSNVTAEPHHVAHLPDLLCAHLHQTVRWWDTLRYLARQGVDTLVEVGPSQVLTKLWHDSAAALADTSSRGAGPLSLEQTSVPGRV